MNVWSQRVWSQCAWLWLAGTLLMLATPGCADPASESERQPEPSSGGLEQAAGDGVFADQVDADQVDAGQVSGEGPAGSGRFGLSDGSSELIPAGTPEEPVAMGESFPQLMPPAAAGNVATPFTIEGSEATEPQTSSLIELRADLSPDQLLEFLAAADGDMQLIFSGKSGIEDPQEARRTLLHIVKMKLDASRRLASNEEVDDRTRSEGARGELQSLSHLAALGNLKAAEELETLALSRLESDDPQLVADSRLVLIGFAIESLQNGDEDAADRLVSYSEQIAVASDSPDVAAMMAMGQARESLTRYGHDREARIVRDRIIELFAGSSEPQIAEMAARLAGSVRFDSIDQLLSQAIEGETVGRDKWELAVGSLIDESADLQTVKYLSGAALELEGCGQEDLATATYALMADRFQEPSAATTLEVKMANKAHQARLDVVGRVFDPELDSVDGAPLSLAAFRGKVVLVPFWAMNLPQSLQVLPQLREVAAKYPEQVVMIGVNMDAEGAQVAEFAKASKLEFRNFRSTNESTRRLGEQFGIVSMPFTAILGKDGQVVDLDFTGKKLQGVIDQLLAQ
ncbi:MAG: TlpA disulfide reductase family protein [Rubripirellula sp.]|nr:TlpA disulfide reductase family protein [Rubripirellula sp.]